VRGRARSFLSRISARVLAFNVLVVFLPIAGILSLDTYEKQLLNSLERSLVQQGRVLAASLEDAGPLLPRDSVRLLQGLRQRHEGRLRVVNDRGELLADSSSIAGEEGRQAPAAETPGAQQGSRTAQETFLYRLASYPVRLWRRYLRPPQPPTESDEYYSGARVLKGPEITDALAGGYGAETRITAGQQSVTLYSAIPIRSAGRVVGAVLVSQSTYRILSDLYALRLDIFRLFLWSVATAVVLSLLVAATITVPVHRLSDQAATILDPRGRLVGGIVASRARDEVGELSRSLGELTARLQKHVRLLESFASDVSHEFKNPLASIRSATELALSSTDPTERGAMLSLVLEDVRRMERLLTGVREISRIDSGMSEEEPKVPVEVGQIAARLIEAARLRGNGKSIVYSVEGVPALTWVPPGRLQQVLENLLDNAVSFSPQGGSVRVSVLREGTSLAVRVSDEGPGILEEHRERIFDRFFTFRPGEEKGVHAGLGLSIVKAIAESHGGAVRAFNLPEKGACFEVRLPAA
jgi:two-component system sensor histidine kinase ChvG